ncbi:F-box protein SNE-like [Rutidosis leptorrhynchoides]|uniref:F-box protein SNE-like n=1 Tax=Rutidosis leptorrhynchoides TaxID=125765 RepID=UPI003A997D28
MLQICATISLPIEKKPMFPINDHTDILIEILQRLDGRTLALAACVCQKWCSIVSDDSLWEHLCFQQLTPHLIRIRPVVLALGGYKRLYIACVRPVMSRLKRKRISNGNESDLVRRVWNRHEVELSLSLFCVQYYERLFGGESPAKSLKFLLV